MAYFSFRIWGWPKLPKSRYFLIRALASAKRQDFGVMAFVSVDKQILNYKVNHALTGCRWGHAGLVYWGFDDELRCIHMLNNGLNDDYLIDLMGECDGMALLWLPMKSEIQYDQFLNLVKEIKANASSINYDYQISLNGKPTDLYCSELVFVTCRGLTIDQLKPVKRHGITAFTPDDLYASGRVLFDEIY